MTKDESVDETVGILPRFLTAEQAMRLLHCAPQTFYTRVRIGVYRKARIRKGDPEPRKMLFRPGELNNDEQKRIRFGWN
ncbi:MAG: hypothetical protein ACLP0B_21510 [Steroidobacteraceae bacterium]